MMDSDTVDALSTATPEPANPAPALATQLPSTTLWRIFKLLQEDVGREGSLQWLSVSHVCRHWRASAFGNRSLWASLDSAILSRDQSLLDTFLEHSGDIPLYLIVDVLPNCNNRALRQAYRTVLTTQLHRIQALVYAHSTEAPWQVVPTAEEIVPYLKGPAPLLHTLRLPGLKRSKFLFREASVLLRFLMNYAPNIRELDIGQFPPESFPWGSPPAAMRTLVLSSDSTVDGASTVTFADMLDGLRAMPALQILSLSGVVPNVTPDTFVDEVVNLPRLQKLCLTGSGEQYALLWYNLKTHTECAVQMEIVRSPDFPTILPAALARYYANCDITPLTELFVKQNAPNGLAYTLFPPGMPPDEGAPPSRPYTHPSVSLFVAWEHKLKNEPYHLPASEIFNATPIPNVKRVTIAAVNAERIESERFAAFGPQLRAIEDLTLIAYRPSQLSSMFLVLGGTLLPENSEEMDRVCMPRLRSLTLKQCCLDQDIAEPTLRDALVRHVRYGVTLDTLSFVDCGLGLGRVKELEVAFVQSGLVRRIISDEV